MMTLPVTTTGRERRTSRDVRVPRSSSDDGSGTPGRTRRRRRRRQLRLIGLVFVLPASIYIVLFQLVPVVYGLLLSFTRYDPLSLAGPQLVGFANYAALFANGAFGTSLLVTGRYVLQVLPPTVLIALLLALLVNRPFKGVGFFRSALYIPHIVSLTAVSMVWVWIYSQNGLVNQIFASFGWAPQTWLLGAGSALNAVSVMRIWKALGSNMVLLLAGLQSIPNELYEASRVDGANRWQSFRHVTLPGLRPMLTYVLAMDIIYLAQSFAEIYVLTQGGPLASTTTVNYLIYTQAFQYNQLGTASAMAFVLFALIIGFSMLTLRSMAGRRG